MLEVHFDFLTSIVKNIHEQIICDLLKQIILHSLFLQFFLNFFKLLDKF